MIKRLALIICSTFLFPVSVQAQVLSEIQQTGVLKVGVRIDAAPFGYLQSNGNLAGYCIDFVELLRQRVKQELNRSVLLIKLYQSSTANRFDLVDGRIADLECGPNTIRDNPDYNIDFSTPFFSAGTQFLRKKQGLFDLDRVLANVTIGVLQGTTTEELIASRYPMAKLAKFEGAMGRQRGVQAVEQGTVDAFASDGILLLGEVAQQGLSLEDYELVPKRPLTCDRYGMILPPNDPQWKSLVNSVIESQRSQRILDNFFAEIALVQTVEDACQ